MAFTYGFYNSLNGDRKYNAFQMSKLFDGIILDGVFESIGQHFAVTASSGMTVNVGTGRAWFNHTWNENDSVMPITLPQSDLNRSRYDAVVIEVGDPNTDRTNAIKVVSGTPAVNPSKPTLNRGPMNNSGVSPDATDTQPPYQHALAYILVQPGVETISATDIQIVVGMDETPFVTGPIETRSIEELFNQWDAQFSVWFTNLKSQLTDNVVTNLQNQIDQNRTAIEGIKSEYKIETVTHTEIIAESTTWKNTTGKDIVIDVLVVGGGGGGSNTHGGNGGEITRKTVTILKDAAPINITVGTGGTQGKSGGTTSFGSYASATGGGSGESSIGSSGGGGGTYSNTAYAGNPGSTYGGGGGGGGFVKNSNAYQGGKGGKGGTYGGGGGAGGLVYYKSNYSSLANTYPTTTISAISGGSGGTYGGNGGASPSIAPGSSTYTTGNSGLNGTNTSNMPNLEFTGIGSGGATTTGASWSGRDTTYSDDWKTIILQPPGGGGGGYGGNGGQTYYPNEPTHIVCGAASSGGGGGGYGANGGNGAGGRVAGSSIASTCGGGGGGGYGGKGGSGIFGGLATSSSTVSHATGYSGQGYGAGGGGKGYSTAGAENVNYGAAGGGGGYGISPTSTQNTTGHDGICIISYTVKELILL